MKVEEGKYYLQRDGKIVGPMVRASDFIFYLQEYSQKRWTIQGYSLKTNFDHPHSNFVDSDGEHNPRDLLREFIIAGGEEWSSWFLSDKNGKTKHCKDPEFKLYHEIQIHPLEETKQFAYRFRKRSPEITKEKMYFDEDLNHTFSQYRTSKYEVVVDKVDGVIDTSSIEMKEI